jgi:ABC-2 type transport system ATP-binding protein
MLHHHARGRERTVLRRQRHGDGRMTSTAVLVEDVHVRFGDVHALAGVVLDVPSGTTLGVLGHNGAGKTTLIRVLTTLIKPGSGRVAVDGLDVVADADLVRRRIGVTGQYAGLDDFLTGRENLELIGRLTGLGVAARGRADDLVDRLDLSDIADRRVGTLSGGSRRRIDLATSLVANPSVLFLDEPTTGLDPVARSVLWDLVGELTETGTTVVLTTQYLEEADRLADDIVVLDHGRVAARGTPTDLKRLVGGKVVTATVPIDYVDRISRHPDETQPSTVGMVRVAYATSDSDEAAAVVSQLRSDGVDIADLDIASPTLDDVFSHLTMKGAHR